MNPSVFGGPVGSCIADSRQYLLIAVWKAVIFAHRVTSSLGDRLGDTGKTPIRGSGVGFGGWPDIGESGTHSEVGGVHRPSDFDSCKRNKSVVSSASIIRSRAWCTITGIETEPLVTEFKRVLGDNRKAEPVVTFDIPNSREFDNEFEQDTEALETTTPGDFE